MQPSHNDASTDVCIIGAGVVGCAIAQALAKKGLKVIVIELNDKQGQGISSRNSEVLHAGLYYPPGSLKARLCVRGRKLLYDYLQKRGISHRKIGKLIVATNPTQHEQLEALKARGERNGVSGLSYISPEELGRIEPDIFATAALLSRESGIVSAHELCAALAADGIAAGAQFVFRTAVTDIKRTNEAWHIQTDSVISRGANPPIIKALSSHPPAVTLSGKLYSLAAKYLINAAGLYSDWIAELAGVPTLASNYSLHWTKGDYFALNSKWRGRLMHLIYPLPPQDLHGLGVHITLDLQGNLRLGPDAFEVPRTEDYLVDEAKAELFFQSAREFLPALELSDLSPMMSGIRPKLTRTGDSVRDFIIAEESSKGLPGLINLIGIESPGLTSSLAIGEHVATLFD